VESGVELWEPLHVQSDYINSLAVHSPFKTGALVATASRDGSLAFIEVDDSGFGSRIGLPETDLQADELAPMDRLNREPLVAHLDAAVAQFTGPDAVAQRCAVIALDGQWGAGKSVLARYLLGRDSDSHLDVWFDAWREAQVAPAWWGMSSAIHRAVSRSRAAPTRVILGLRTLTSRLWSPLVFWMAVVVVLLVGALVSPLGQRVAGSQVLGLITSALALTFLLARSLFWYSPSLGSLHLRFEENPLGEVARIVRLWRRWAPRRTGNQDFADYSLFFWTTGLVTCRFVPHGRIPNRSSLPWRPGGEHS
jgi:hypothetical protein